MRLRPEKNKVGQKRWDKKEPLFLTAILLVALLLRVMYPGLSSMGTDETEFYERTMQSQETKDSILDGKSYEGNQFFGPFMFYLFAIPLSITDDYRSLSVLYGILGVVEVGLVYVWARRYFSRTVAVIASMLLATSPWHNVYSRIPYNLAPISLLAIIFVMSLMSCCFEEDKKWPFIGMVISLSLMLQVHLSAFAFIPLLLIAWAVNWKKIKVSYIVTAAVLSLVFFSPFIYYNLTNDFIGIKEVLFLPQQHPENNFVTNSIEAIGIPALLATNHLGAYFLGSLDLFPKSLDLVFLAMAGITLLFLGAGIGYAAHSLRKEQENKERVKYLILLGWLVIPIALLILRNRNISPHFYYMLFPLQFVFMGLSIEKGMDFFKRIQKKGFAVFLCMVMILLVLSNAFYFVTFAKKVSEAGSTDGTYGVTYKNKEEVINEIQQDAQSDQLTLVFYKKRDSGFSIILKDKDILPTYEIAKDIQDLSTKKGYLIVDMTSRYGIKGIAGITEEELSYFNDLQSNNNTKRVRAMNILKLEGSSSQEQVTSV